MKHRKLWIAWSIWWGAVAVLFMVLWVRSYWWYDIANVSGTGTASFLSYRGGFGFVHSMSASTQGIQSVAVDDIRGIIESKDVEKASYWQFFVRGSEVWIRVPYWFLVMLFGVLTAVPWPRWSKRYSLRTLLIATTLVAVGLGVIIYFMRG